MPFSPGSQSGKSLAGGWTGRWLVPAIYAACGLAFAADLLRADTLAFGIAYIPLVATALIYRRRWVLWLLTGISVVLIAIGAFVPTIAPDLYSLIANRVLSILAILATAALVGHARGIQDRLAAATRRAEAAEQIKTDVLNSLSQEMRTPLHSLIGLLGLVMADCSPDQREALGRVRADGRQLLLSIDNLADLTRIGDRQLQPQPIDVKGIVQDAIAGAQPIADDRGVQIVVEQQPPRPNLLTIADPWATRRILENLIYGTLRQTGGAGTVRLSIAQDNAATIVSVEDRGLQLYSDLQLLLAGNAPVEPETSPINLGLTLSVRLARAMGGALAVENRADTGPLVSLKLPLQPGPT